MYIQVDSPATRRVSLKIEGFEEPVCAEFNEDRVARVQKEVGEALAQAIEGIEIIEREDSSSQEDDE